jgi:hypothetical protein
MLIFLKFDVLTRLSCPDSPVLAVVLSDSPVLSWQSYFGSSVVIALSW